MERENFGSRLGFILISAGCAIGLGNVWRFPYIVGKYGGAIFILIYFLFLIIFGLPIMSMEFSVGRASRKSIAHSFEALEPKGTKWHLFSYIGMAGNYLLMMFYTTVTGWMFAYFFKMLRGDFAGQLSSEQISAQFDTLNTNSVAQVGFMLLATVLGFTVCSLGLQKGVEKITKVMMLLLLGIISVLAVHSVTLNGAAEGIKYYLVPDIKNVWDTTNGTAAAVKGFGDVIFAALGQAFFTLSIGMGTMAIFGSYIPRDRKLFGESVLISALDTFVAIMAGFIIIPACFAYDIPQDAGPNLIFKTLPTVFNRMTGGRIWGTLFFLFMIFAAMSTVIAVLENIISFGMDLRGWSRKKSVIINLIALSVLALPCALGSTVFSFFAPLGAGTGVLDFEDFLISENILPLGSIVYVLFCSSRYGWGYDNFINEANCGKGIAFPRKIRIYVSYILPVIVLLLWISGYITRFFA